MSNGSGRSFIEAIGICFRKYAVFQGRAPRSEFWWWALFQFLLGVAVDIVFPPDTSWMAQHYNSAAGVTVQSMGHHGSAIGALVSLALFLPSLAVAVRRLHDIGKSGWWLLISFIPVVGWIILLIWDCRRGAAGGNEYGSDPLQEV
jgi:uncharacterized membrane protein YhaH (DUF805 family)